jgi:acyl carrier protein
MSTLISEAEILDDLRRVFRESLGVDPVSPIDPTTKFFADLGLASIDAVVLGEAIQQQLGRRVPFDQLLVELGKREERDLEIRELIAFLQRHL